MNYAEEEGDVLIAWSPQPKQARLISCPAQEIFFGGSRGGGKTDGVLGHFLHRADTYGPAAKGLMLRRTMKGFNEIESRSKEIYGKLFPIKDHWYEQKKMWEFPNGARLHLNYCESDDDVRQYTGHSYPFIYPDELQQWKNESTYEWLFTINRSPTVAERCQVVCTGNPGDVGHVWVKKRFVDFGEPDRVHEVTFPDPRNPDGPPLVRTRAFIPSHLRDNKYLYGTGYEVALLALPERLRKMQYDGRWDVVEGQFFDEWDPEVHVCRAFNPPPDWERWFAFDWGFDAPYAGLWFCRSPFGRVYVYREIYGLKPDGASNKGTRENARAVAQKIRQIEYAAGEHIFERWVDGSIYDGDGGEASIGVLFEREGVFFQKAKKRDKPGGITLLRQMMQVINKQSLLQIMDNCRDLIRTIPDMVVDPHSPGQYLSKNVEDHLVDCLYMGCRKNLPSPEDLRMMRVDAVPSNQWGSGGWR